MTLSSNWKSLSTRIDSAKKQVTGSKNLGKKHKFQQKDASKLRKNANVVPPSSAKLLTPLEYALWTCTPYSYFEIKPGSAARAVELTNKKKLASGKYIAIDCEFVGVGSDDSSALARVSVINYFGVVLLDTYVRPEGHVTNWRTWVSGVTPHHMKKAITTKEAREKVQDLLYGKVIVGHAVHNDLECLGLSIPRHLIRDTSRYPAFRKQNGGKTPSLRKLCQLHLKLQIQNEAHSSVEDAQATMALFRLHQRELEAHFSR